MIDLDKERLLALYKKKKKSELTKDELDEFRFLESMQCWDP